MISNYLIHHGRKDQKWGVQNGPPYPLDVNNKDYKKKQENSNPSESRSEQVLKNSKKITDNSSSVVNKLEKYKKEDAPKKDTSQMSDQELRNTINRLEMEKRYNDLTYDEVSKGEKFVMRALDVAGDVIQIAAGAVGIFVLLKRKGI